MEIKINKEIRNYYEQFIMGMSLRNMVFALIGIAVGLIIGFSLRGKASMEALSWIIPAAVVPFFLFGFKKVNGMYMEKFMAVWFRSVFLFPKKLILKDDNIYRLDKSKERGKLK